MIMLVLRIVRVRRRRALGVLLLAAFTLAVAVAAPAYLAAADRSVIAAEVSQAGPDETGLHVTQTLDLRQGTDRTFETGEPAHLSAPWLETTFGVDTDVITTAAASGGRTLDFVPQLVFRQDYCAHVTLLSGRCPVAVREVLLDPTLAAALHVGPGDAVAFAWAVRTPTNGWVPRGPQMRLSVVGVYQPVDPDGAYWGVEHYFTAAGSERGDVGPVLTERGTLEVFPHQSDSASTAAEADERQRVDAVLVPGALTPDMLATVRARLAQLTGDGAALPAVSGMPALLDRIDADRATMRQIVPAVAVPLVVLGCLVLFLVVAYAAADKRPEVAAVRLRGAGRWDRWAVVTGESVLPVVVAVPVGLLAGPLLAWAAAGATLTGPVVVPFVVTRPLLAAATVVAMLVMVLAAYRRVLAEPVGEVVRAVPARASAWRSYTLEALVVVVAAVAVAQLYVGHGPLAGVTLGAPALVVTAAAVLVGWLVPPAVSRLGARSLGLSERAGRRRRRARLAVGLGALTLARRPGAQRLLAVQVIAVGLAGFVAATAAGAAQARAARVVVDLGAPRVLSVSATSPSHLVAAVRAADPSGRYAMAAVAVTPADSTGGAVLAVDSARLASVATWPSSGGTDPAALAAALHPTAPAPVRITGTFIEITVTASVTSLEESPPPALSATLEPFDGSIDSLATFGPLVNGTHTYRAQTSSCVAGCRLAGVTVAAPPGSAEQVRITVQHLDVAEPTRSRVDLPWQEDDRWRVVPDPSANEPPVLLATVDGLTEASSVSLTTRGMTFAPRDTPYPLPALFAGGSSRSKLNGMDGGLVDLTPVGHVDTVPRLGTAGTLVDLGYLDQLSTIAVSPPPPSEVWLAADAPPGIETALRKAGVAVTGSRTAAAEQAFLAHQGPAIGYVFGLLAAGAAVLLAAACVMLLAGVERRRRVVELGALRVQGLRVATARRATVVGQLGLVVVAGVAGAVAAAVAWRLTGSRLPVFADGSRAGIGAGGTPWWALLLAVAASVVVLGAAAVAVAVGVGRGVAAPSPAGGGGSAVDGTPRQVSRRDEVVGSVR